MLQLIILRHAEAETKAGKPDRDRILTARGRDDARAMGARLAQANHRLDLVIVSPAARTRETCALVMDSFNPAPPVTVEEDLYGFGDITPYLTALAEHAQGCARVLIVGHNPSVHSLALRLAGNGETLSGFPTAAAAVLNLSGHNWAEISGGEGRLAAFLTPEDGH